MPNPAIHAPHGSTLCPGALCESPSGDVTTRECDVDCPDCLDLLAESSTGFQQLARGTQALRAPLTAARHPLRQPRGPAVTGTVNPTAYTSR